MTSRTLLEDSRQLQRAVRMIQLGARLQMLQAETELPYERLLRLYKEVAGKSPSKGQLPFSTDWFMTWQPNIHASLFFNIFRRLSEHGSTDAMVSAYELYLEEVESAGIAPLLTLTRSWRLVRFHESGMLAQMSCTRCGGQFINHAYELASTFVCGLCAPPARAGKARRKGALH